MNIHEALVGIIRRTASYLAFNILEIGSMPADASPEPFHSLIHSFPGSRINAFEVDAEVCRALNSRAINGVVHHPVALGRREEERPFYITNHPTCCSLYKPNGKLLERFLNMEVAMLKAVGKIKTVSLDYFTAKNSIGPVDFIKIDIQGAELEVFQGGLSTLKDVVAIVTEVEFIHLYENQPLFGDVNAFLIQNGFSFHNFLGLAGRALKPSLVNNDPNYPSQHIWTDAIFLKDLMQLDAFSSDQLLKLSVLASIYGILDVPLYCFMEYDRRHGTGIARELLFACAGTSDSKQREKATSSTLGAANASGISRNDPCPCGSGKKYKHCHGNLHGAQ